MMKTYSHTLRLIRPASQSLKILVPDTVVDDYVDMKPCVTGINFFKYAMSSSQVYLDIGGDYGFFALVAASTYPQLQVFAVESRHDYNQILQKNVDINGVRNVRCLEQDDEASLRSILAGISGKTATIRLGPCTDKLRLARAVGPFVTNLNDVKTFIDLTSRTLIEESSTLEELFQYLWQQGFDTFWLSTTNGLFLRVSLVEQLSRIIETTRGGTVYCLKRTQSLSIFFVSHSGKLGGAELSLLDLTRQLIRTYGCICTTLLPSNGPLQLEMQAIGGGTLVVPSTWWAVIKDRSPAISASHLADSVGRIAREALPVILDIKPDVIFTQTLVVPWGAIIANYIGKPHVWSICEDDYGLDFVAPIQQILSEVAYTSSHIFSLPGPFETFGHILPKDKSEVLYRMIELDPGSELTDEQHPCNRPDGPPPIRVAVIGFLHERKNQSEAILAVSRLIKEGYHIELTLVGGGDKGYITRLQALTNAEGISESVRFAGYIKDPYKLMACMDIIVNCSRSEAFGRSIAEAMILGRAIVYPDIPGPTAYMVDGMTGLCYKVGDDAQLADKIKQLADNPGLARRLGEQAREHARQVFGPEHFSQKVYDRLLSIKNRGLQGPPFPTLLHEILGLLSERASGSPEIPSITRGMSQLFVDTGKGFNETESLRIYHDGSDDTLSFNIGDFHAVRALRFDPWDGPCVLQINSARIVTDTGQDLTVKLIGVNAFFEDGSKFFFNHPDPSLLLAFSTHADRMLLVEFRVQFLTVLLPDGKLKKNTPVDQSSDGKDDSLGRSLEGGKKKSPFSYAKMNEPIHEIGGTDVGHGDAGETKEQIELGRKDNALENTPIDIIIPVYRGFKCTRDCLESILTSNVETPYEIIVIDDKAPELDLINWLESMDAEHKITLIKNQKNLGFVESCNRGMRLHQDRDVLLLNSDTVVANDWLDRMIKCAYKEASIATVTPFSNNATIFSYPKFCEPNNLPNETTIHELDRLCAEANPGDCCEVPTGHGFCMYIKRAALNDVGYFDEESFGAGYGEENDLCQRLIRRGWKNVLAADVFVEHIGAVSFGAGKQSRMDVANCKIAQLHPNYHRDVHCFIKADPVRRYRLSVDVLRLIRDEKPLLLFVTHNLRGGVQKHVADLTEILHKTANVLVMKPSPGGVHVELSWDNPGEGFRCTFDSEHGYENLLTFLGNIGVSRLHYHHLINYPQRIGRLATELGVPYDFTIHDYFNVCPHINLVPPLDEAKYCGELGIEHCRKCMAAFPVTGCDSIDQWRENYERLLTGAERVFAPSHDTAARIKNYFPSVKIIEAPHPERTSPFPEPSFRVLGTNDSLRVAVIGAISKVKGADILEACAIDASRKNLPLEFTLIGYAYRPLVQFPKSKLKVITGPYKNSDLQGLLSKHSPDLVWFPAVWPETFSYTLSEALIAGLPVTAVNIGPFMERLAGRKWSFIGSWDRAPHDINKWLLEIRKHFEAGEGPQLEGETSKSEFDYANDYLNFKAPPRSSHVTERHRRAIHALGAEKQHSARTASRGKLALLAQWVISSRVGIWLKYQIPLKYRERIRIAMVRLGLS